MTPEAILQSLPKRTLDILRVVQNAGYNTYLVGGILRDVVLGVSLKDNDLDFVVETQAEQVARYMQNILGGDLTHHPAFGTFTLKTSDFHLDVTTARKETYAYPGALPSVSFSTIYDDLARRDFSINAIALNLQVLELLDPHQGLKDLETKTLRFLHATSFLDDPTRMIRGARLAGRLGLNWDAQTQKGIKQALQSEAVKNISKDRMKAELELCLAEEKVLPVLKELRPVLNQYFGLSYSPEVIQGLDSYQKYESVPIESYLLSMLINLENPEPFLMRFNYPLRFVESLQRIKTGLKGLGSDLFARLNQAEKYVLKAGSPSLDKHIHDLEIVFSKRRLSGQDVLDLGLLPGPSVGHVLAEVSKARDRGQVSGFEQELELAKKLVLVLQESK